MVGQAHVLELDEMKRLLQLPTVEVVKCNLGITVDDGSVRESA